MRALAAIGAVLAASVVPAAAATHESESYSVTLEPEVPHNEYLKCPTGTLVSGGYSIDSMGPGGPFDRIFVILNGPVAPDAWGVGLLNTHDAPIDVDFRISLLCE
jgi:hypothetical protein